MTKNHLYILLVLLFSVGVPRRLFSQQPNDIAGFWISSQRNVIVQIFDTLGSYHGRIAWFDDTDDLKRPMRERMDIHNPSKELRSRKILGLDVLSGLIYDDGCKCWEKGKIYDTQSGKTWDATVFQENVNRLKVRGFWHFQFFGKSMIFQRYTGPVEQL